MWSMIDSMMREIKQKHQENTKEIVSYKICNEKPDDEFFNWGREEGRN